MKILAVHITTTTQIHNGKCYLIGVFGKYDAQSHNIEASGTAAAGNTVHKYEEGSGGYGLPKPGVECTNGLNVVTGGWTTVYYSLG